MPTETMSGSLHVGKKGFTKAIQLVTKQINKLQMTGTQSCYNKLNKIPSFQKKNMQIIEKI